jgi:Ca2+:H+ antiporter
LIVSVIALVKGEYIVVKTSLIGSILSNLLLVMGMCFFFGGLRRPEQFFNITVAQTAASLLALAIASIIIPTVFANWVTFPKDTSDTDKLHLTAEISRGTSMILLFVYGCYLYFQLSTHAFMYQLESQKVAMRPMKHHLPEGGVKKAFALGGGVAAAQGRTHPLNLDVPPNGEIMRKDAIEQQKQSDGEEEDEPQLHLWVAIFTLAASTVIVAICAEFLVSSIDGITKPSSGVSVEFVGLILLPIVGNAAEHATAVTVAVKDKMDLAIGVAVGSSMQIALLVLPFTVILGWILGHDEMNLSFDGFQVAVLFVSVLLVNYLIMDGRSHWLEGVLLQCLYIIIAVT